ncbi:uncharacterized protein LOC111591748, partial [Ceratitis capitata]|uniref:uncharacterized protein LOC111591748 n=1 Tax=Ceratitis capitata TaxID=7213 RepID=UPI000C6C6493
MSKQTRQYMFLEDINNIGEEFSEISEDEFSEIEDILVENKNEFDSTDTDDEEENIVNVCGGRKRIRNKSSKESEVEINEQNVANGGSVRQQIQVGGTPGRAPLHNIFRQEVGPTGNAKRHIMK